MANIGRLALTVTTNAAPALKDLDSFEKKASATSKSVEKSVEKAGGGEGGGFMSSFLGGAAGGAIGVALAGVAKGFGQIVPMMEDARKNALALGQSFTALENANLDRVENAFHGVKSEVAGTFAKIVSALEPAITALASGFVDLLRSARPVLTWIAEKGAAAISIGFQAIAGFVRIVSDQIVSLFSQFAQDSGLTKWFQSWGDWDTNVKSVMRAMAKGFAYVWDVAKAFGGVVAQNFATMAEGAANLIRSMQKYRTHAAAAAAVVGGANAANAVLGVNQEQLAILDDMAKAARAAGANMVGSFGQTAKDVDKLFDKIDKRIEKTAFAAKFVAYNPSAALLAGSAQEYSVRTKFSMENMLNPQLDVAKQQLAQQKAATDILKRVQDELREIRLNLDLKVI